MIFVHIYWTILHNYLGICNPFLSLFTLINVCLNCRLGKVVDKEKLKIEGYKKYLVRRIIDKDTVDSPMTEITVSFKMKFMEQWH
jgi:hypothetical protein